MAAKSLKSYAEENNLPTAYVYDRNIDADRTLIIGFKSTDDVLKCAKTIGGYPCRFETRTLKEGTVVCPVCGDEAKEDEFSIHCCCGFNVSKEKISEANLKSIRTARMYPERIFLGELKQNELEHADVRQVGVFKLSRYDRTYLREDTCARCYYCCEYNPRGKTNRCARTKRSGSIERAHWCSKFKHRNSSGLYYKNGVPVRSKTRDDYRTEIQWKKVGRYIKDGEEGIAMYSTMNTSKTYVYYLMEQTFIPQISNFIP